MDRRPALAVFGLHPSIGPRSADRGNASGVGKKKSPTSPSIGPRSADRGNRSRTPAPCADEVPSIGPRSADRGNRPGVRLLGADTHLQLGRDQLIAEIVLLP